VPIAFLVDRFALDRRGAWVGGDGTAPPGYDELMTEGDDRVLVVTVRLGDTVEIWTREGMSRSEFARVMRAIADQFEAGTAERVDAGALSPPVDMGKRKRAPRIPTVSVKKHRP
jgi:hypothetical protein